jgi:hypothetical protein
MKDGPEITGQPLRCRGDAVLPLQGPSGLDTGEVPLSQCKGHGERSKRDDEPSATPAMEGVERGKSGNNARPPHRNPQR